MVMKMHAKERKVPQTRAHQAIWGEWLKCLPWQSKYKEEEKKKEEKRGISIHMDLAAGKPHK